MRLILAVLLTCVVAACSATQPDTVVSPKLDSGITSNNGGGARQLNNNNSMGITTRTGPTP